MARLTNEQIAQESIQARNKDSRVYRAFGYVCHGFAAITLAVSIYDTLTTQGYNKEQRPERQEILFNVYAAAALTVGGAMAVREGNLQEKMGLITLQGVVNARSNADVAMALKGIAESLGSLDKTLDGGFEVLDVIEETIIASSLPDWQSESAYL